MQSVPIPELAGLNNREAQGRIATAISVLMDEPGADARDDNGDITEAVLLRVYARVGESRDDKSARTRARVLNYLRRELVRRSASMNKAELCRTLEEMRSMDPSSWNLHHARRTRRRVMVAFGSAVVIIVVSVADVALVVRSADQLRFELAASRAATTAANASLQTLREVERTAAERARRAEIATEETRKASGVVITQPAITARVGRRFRISGLAGTGITRVLVSVYSGVGAEAEASLAPLIRRNPRVGADGTWLTTVDLQAAGIHRPVEPGSQLTVVAEVIQEERAVATASRLLTVSR